MKTTIRAFIGTSVISSRKGTFALTISGDDRRFYMPVKMVFSKKITSHLLVLEAIRDLLKSFETVETDETISLLVYCGDDLVAYEYNVELLKENSLPENAEGRELLLEILALSRKLSDELSMQIIGTDTILEPYIRKAGYRALRVSA